ncbi:MAG: epimerase [Anaerolineae bacterium]|nr:MAG: epimerase [Anaerolineae bacterium]
MSLNAFVTGATGHIGNVLVRQLLARGQRVRALIHSGKDAIPLHGLNVQTVSADLAEDRLPEGLLTGIDTVYHSAARIQIAPGGERETMRINLDGTLRLLDAAQRAGVRRFVFVSSVHALRVPQEGIVDETLPFAVEHAHGVYDRSKAAASLAVLQANASGFETVVACPTGVVGPYDFRLYTSGRGVLYNISPGLKFFINGAFDFVDVRDVAQGLILAAEQGRAGQTYILGAEQLTLEEMARVVWETAGGWHVGIRLPDGIALLAAHILPLVSKSPMLTPYALETVRARISIRHTKAQQELGYSPRPVREALRDATRWFLLGRERWTISFE